MSSSLSPGKDTSHLYAELSKLQSTGDFEKAVKVTNKILNADPRDFTAFHCKIVALLQSGKFDDALRQMNPETTANPKFLPDIESRLMFERAYCLYRSNRPEDALQIINSSASLSLKEKELKAQILYRLERYEECFEVYRDIVKNTSEDDFDLERRTNMAAALVNIPNSNFHQKKADLDESYELCYNAACGLLSQGKWLEAEKALRKAEAMAVAFLKEEEEDIEEEELEKETGIIRVQLGFALQMQGREREAQAIYNQVLKNKPADIGLVAVASNNLLTLNKDQNIFDSKKRLKACVVEGLESKLTSVHRLAIAHNAALLAMYTNQVNSCRELVNELAEKFQVPKKEQDFILAGVLSRSGKTSEAVNLLVNNNVDLERILVASQILLEKGDRKAALNLMETKLPVEDKYRMGILSALVTLYLASDQRAEAARLLKDAVAYNLKNKRKNENIVWRKTAEFHLKGGEPAVAAQALEELLKTNPKDRTTLAHLVLAYAKFDLQKALETSKKLPEFTEISVDVDALESSAFLGGKKKVLGAASPSVTAAANESVAADQDKTKRRKTKKKRKKRLPKNYDPNVDPDPERWIPKRERMAFRKPKRDRRNKGGEKFTGAQGTSALSGRTGDSFDYSGKKASTKSPKSPQVSKPQAPVGPRQQQRKPQQKKKKKKGF